MKWRDAFKTEAISTAARPAKFSADVPMPTPAKLSANLQTGISRMYRCAGAVQTLRPGKYPRNRELGWQLVGALVKQTTVQRPLPKRCTTVAGQDHLVAC